MIKAAKEVRMKIDDALQINKIENFLNTMRNDVSKKAFIREVSYEAVY